MKDFLIIDLQLFDNHVNVTTDARTEGQTYPDYNDLSAEMKTFYNMTLIEEASPQLVHAQFGQKRSIPKNGGKTIEFRKFLPLPKATTALTEGVTPDGKRLEATAITATVKQYGDYITQSDFLELTALDNTIYEAVKLLGKQAGLTIDTLVRNELVGGTNVTYCPTISGTTETAVTSRADLDPTAQLTVKVVQKVVAKLRGQNAPTINGSYVAIAHPYVLYALMRDPEWIDAHKYATPENIYKGEVGQIAGVRFVSTTEAKVWNDNTCPPTSEGATTYHSVYATLFIGEGAYGVIDITGGGMETIVKQKGSSGTADPLNQRSSVGWKATNTQTFLVPTYLVRVESCVADFDATPAN